MLGKVVVLGVTLSGAVFLGGCSHSKIHESLQAQTDPRRSHLWTRQSTSGTSSDTPASEVARPELPGTGQLDGSPATALPSLPSARARRGDPARRLGRDRLRSDGREPWTIACIRCWPTVTSWQARGRFRHRQECHLSLRRDASDVRRREQPEHATAVVPTPQSTDGTGLFTSERERVRLEDADPARPRRSATFTRHSRSRTAVPVFALWRGHARIRARLEREPPQNLHRRRDRTNDAHRSGVEGRRHRVLRPLGALQRR